jgi:citrate lyase subunit beta / citryl-CoA lyase
MDPFAMGPALLFCPADRPERYAKAAQRSDAVILDLEDAVAAADKAAARAALIDSGLDPERTLVRVNAIGTDDFPLDLEALARTDYRTVMVPKASSAEQLAAVAGFQIVALCETAAGIVNAPAIAAAPDVVGLMWGAEDLLASLGGTSSRTADGRYREVALHARSSVLLAAGANGKSAVDSVYLDIADLAGLEAEAADAVASGFAAKACIHPGQVPVIRSAYRPSAAEVEAAVALLEAARHERGVFRFAGRMVDEPVLRHARQTARRARAMQE